MFDRLKSIFPTTPQAAGKITWLVVGLGNPGKKYEQTRHNAGVLAVDYISKKLGFAADRLKFKSLTGEGIVSGKKVLFLKPTTYMNNSGQAVVEAINFYKLPLENIIVLSDDVTLPVGAFRIRSKGSDGGQKGMRSIIELTGDDNIPRIKIGVGGKPYPNMQLADWVLSPLTTDDQKLLLPLWEDVFTALEIIIGGDMQSAMNRFNVRGQGKPANNSLGDIDC